MDGATRPWAMWLALVGMPLATGLAVLLVVVRASAAMGPMAAEPPRNPSSVSTPEPTTLDVPPLIPGDAVRRCVDLVLPAIEGAPVDLALFGASNGDLVPHLALAVRLGDPGSTCAEPGILTSVYDGPFAGFDDAVVVDGFDRSDARAWSSVAVVVDVTLAASTPNTAQGAPASLDLTWEVAPHDRAVS